MRINKARLRKIILEEVNRRLLSEKKTVLDPLHYGAMMIFNPRELDIHVYKINKDNDSDQIEVIGTITLSKTDEPCIPRTFQVDSIAVKEEYHGRGIGLDLYRFAMGVLDNREYGITSDHSSGTKEKATEFWVRLGSDAEKNAGLAYKRQTDMGNDTFDYDGSTPDPNDDCETVAFSGNNATDHSFRINPSEAGPARNQLMQLMRKHLLVKRAFERGQIRASGLRSLNANALERYIEKEASKVFIEEYGKAI
jgi:GNAT superfamily N-acetyltransferase